MIVKNESKVIERCLKSVQPFIDTWVIVDTGSTDGTQDIIKNTLKDLPGKLYERPWVDFSHNRNEALQLAEGGAEYILFMDADDFFCYDEGFNLKGLDKDYYFVQLRLGGTEYDRVQLIKNRGDWSWKGVIHEYLEVPLGAICGKISGAFIQAGHEGARSQDPEKYLKDVRILERALDKEPYNNRYAFYLAQSYKSAGNLEKSIECYEKRIAMKGWDQEVFWSMLQVALMQDQLGKETAIVEASLIRAFKQRPCRAEPLYYLMNLYRRNNEFKKGYEVGKIALSIPNPGDSLFIQKWIYDYGILFEFSILAYWAEHYQESFTACEWLLEKPYLPIIFREYSVQNRKFALEKAQEKNKKAIEEFVKIGV